MKIVFNKVHFSYHGTEVFRALDVTVERGSLTAVVGPNGSGKSTLLSLLAGIIRPIRGRIHIDASDIALAVQRSEVTDSFPITVAEAVMMGRWKRLGLFRRPRSDDRAVVEHWLTEFSLADLRDRTLGELSGGQRQKVLLAQTFAQEAELVLLDEPTTGLDAASAALALGHLRRLAAAGTTVVAATHDAAVIDAADHRLDLSATPGPDVSGCRPATDEAPFG